MVINELIATIEQMIDAKVIQCKSVGGGSIAQSFHLIDGLQRRYFIKTSILPEMIEAEAIGLAELQQSGAIAVARVVAVNPKFLLLKWIESTKRNSSFFEQFGRQLAALHRVTQVGFGFRHHNYIGLSPQINNKNGQMMSCWKDFYHQYRLLPQYNALKQKGKVDSHFEKLFDNLLMRLDDILGDVNEPPSLIHGDLWGGNYLTGEKGEPVLIDPAVYYGHREAELAMTKLFGGFDETFYKAYQKEWPLAKGYQHREPLYLLYHVLNHFNLFGVSYRAHAIELLRYYD